jgi:hypothetical protein
VDSWESTRPIVEQLSGQNISFFRTRFEGKPLVILDKGVARDGFPERAFESAPNASTSILNRILERSVGDELQRRGLTISRDRSGVFAHDTRHVAGTGLLQTAPGIGIKPFRTGADYGAVIWWDVKTEFKEALSSLQLQKIAVGAPVLALHGSATSKGREFAGVLIKVQNRTKGLLRNRRGATTTIDLAEYTLEATPRVLQQYARVVLRGSSRDLLRSVQRASFALDEHGAKNKRVLHDRLQAILGFLSVGGIPRLEFSLSVPNVPPVTLALSPAEAVEQ